MCFTERGKVSDTLPPIELFGGKFYTSVLLSVSLERRYNDHLFLKRRPSPQEPEYTPEHLFSPAVSWAHEYFLTSRRRKRIVMSGN